MSVLVFTENWDGKFKKSSFELISYASQVAGMLNTTTTVLSLGKVEKSELESAATLTRVLRMIVIISVYIISSYIDIPGGGLNLYNCHFRRPCRSSLAFLSKFDNRGKI